MAVKLSPFGNQQFVTETGAPANGWLLNTYIAGSSTPVATYTDSTGTVPQSNPIVLNTLGFPTNGQIWLTSGTLTKFQLTDALGNVKKTEDNVGGINDSTNTVTQWISSGLTPTYISATSFSLIGDQTTDFHIGRRLQFLTTAGTVYGAIVTSAYTTLTTVTVRMDLATALDSGLSVVNLSILRADHGAVPIGAVPILTQSASTSASIDFTLDTSFYETFFLAYSGVVPVTNSDTLICRGLVAGVLQTGSVYSHENFSFTGSGSGVGGVQNDSLAYLSPLSAVSNVANNGVYGSLTLVGAGNTAGPLKQLSYSGSYWVGSAHGCVVGSVVFLIAQALSGIRISFAGGNISTGKFTLYGLRKAF